MQRVCDDGGLLSRASESWLEHTAASLLFLAARSSTFLDSSPLHVIALFQILSKPRRVSNDPVALRHLSFFYSTIPIHHLFLQPLYIHDTLLLKSG